MNIHKLRVELLILGLSIKEPISGKFFSVKSAEIKDKGNTLKNCIHFLYSKEMSVPEKTLNQEQINIFLIKEIKLLLQSLALFLSRPFQLVKYSFWIDENAVHISLPPRSLPPGIYNMIGVIRRNRINESLLGGYTAEIKPIFWENLELFIEKFHEEFEENNKKFHLTLEWVAKGNSEVLIGRLIAYWIALNTQYKNLDRQESEAIKIFIKNNIDKTIAKRMVKKKH